LATVPLPPLLEPFGPTLNVAVRPLLVVVLTPWGLGATPPLPPPPLTPADGDEERDPRPDMAVMAFLVAALLALLNWPLALLPSADLALLNRPGLLEPDDDPDEPLPLLPEPPDDLDDFEVIDGERDPRPLIPRDRPDSAFLVAAFLALLNWPLALLPSAVLAFPKPFVALVNPLFTEENETPISSRAIWASRATTAAR